MSSNHRDDTRFKWTIVALSALVALAFILGTITELVK